MTPGHLDHAADRRARFGGSAMIFMCGSLLEGARRHDLFGSELPTFDAKLRNWSRARGSDGRYFAMPSPGDAVEGVVVPVDPAQIEKADRAQSLANLHRAIAIVDVDDVRTWAFVYTRREDAMRVA